jgi:nucleoid-associated protein YgaU
MNDGLSPNLEFITPSSIMEIASGLEQKPKTEATATDVLSSQADAQVQSTEGSVSVKNSPIEFSESPTEPVKETAQSTNSPASQQTTSNVTNNYNQFSIGGSEASAATADFLNSPLINILLEGEFARGQSAATNITGGSSTLSNLAQLVSPSTAATAASTSTIEAGSTNTDMTKAFSSLLGIEINSTVANELFGNGQSLKTADLFTETQPADITKLLPSQSPSLISTGPADEIASVLTTGFSPSSIFSSPTIESEPLPTVDMTVSPVEPINVSVETQSPIKNKSTINQIMNPVNPVAVGVDNLGQTITNTSNMVASTISKSMSSLSQVVPPGNNSTTQYFNETNSSVISQPNSSGPIASQSIDSKSEPVVQNAGLSEYYLNAIYDALVSHGIKIRTV